MHQDAIRLRTVFETWQDTRGDGGRLKTIISINDTLMHLEAILVHDVGNDRQQAAVSECDARDFNLLCQLGSEGPFDTTEIDGKAYVLIATPFT
jgi:hypothetical protein